MFVPKDLPHYTLCKVETNYSPFKAAILVAAFGLSQAKQNREHSVTCILISIYQAVSVPRLI